MKQRKQYIKWLSWLPVLIMMVIIFMFSAKTATASDETSSPIAEAIVHIWEVMFGTIRATKRPDVMDLMNFIVRKIAHITEYTILALLISFSLWVNGLQEKKRFLFALLLSVLYAGTDEYHQTFVEGRSGSIRDVGIDSIGIVLGCTLFFIAIRCIIKRKNKSAVKRSELTTP